MPNIRPAFDLRFRALSKQPASIRHLTARVIVIECARPPLSLELFRVGVGCPPVPECLIGQQVDPGPVRGDILPKSLGRFACVVVAVWLTVLGCEVVHAFITRDLEFSGQTGAVIVAARSCSFGGHDVWCAAGTKRTEIADTSR